MSDFLDKLKKSVEEGTFNSDVANKINEISTATDKLVNNIKDDVINEVNESDETNVNVEVLISNKLENIVEKKLEGNKAEPVDEKTALQKNIEAEKTMLKWEHDTKMLKYQARIFNDLTPIVKQLIELVETTNNMLSQINKDDIEMNEIVENVVNTSVDFLSNIYEKDLQVKEFLTKFASKYRMS